MASQVEKIESETKLSLGIEKGMIVKEETYQTKSYYKNTNEAMATIKDSMSNYIEQIKSTKQFSQDVSENNYLDIDQLFKSQKVFDQLAQERKASESNSDDQYDQNSSTN